MKKNLLILLIAYTLVSCGSTSNTTSDSSNVSEKISKLFSRLDADSSGYISKAEADNSPKKAISENFDKLDANSDGKLSLDELSSQLQILFKK